MRHKQKRRRKKNQKHTLSFFLCLLLLQINPQNKKPNVGLLNWPSATANLHTIGKTFIVKNPSIDKSKSATNRKDLSTYLLEDFKTDQM